MFDLNALRRRKKAVLDMRAIMDAAEAQGRTRMTADEDARFDALDKSVRAIDASLSEWERENGPIESHDEYRSLWNDGRPLNGRIHTDGMPCADSAELIRLGDAVALRSNQRMRDHVHHDLPEGIRPDDLDFGKYLRGLVTGNWNNAAAEKRVASTSDGILGGYLLPSPLSADVIDLARNRASVLRAGALTIPMTSASLDIACLTKDPTASWKVENAPVTASDPNTGRFTLRARTLVGLVKSSVELIEDAPNAGTIIRNALSQALALELDRAALRGIGAGEEPLGIRNWTSLGSNFGAQLIPLAGTMLFGFDQFSQAWQLIQTANGPAEGLSVIYSPREAGTIDRMKDGDGTPIIPAPSWMTMAKFTTNQIPVNLGDDGNESEAYVGTFSQLGIGMRTGVTLEVSRQAADSEGSAFTNLQVWIRAYLRADVVLLQPTWFVLINGIVPPPPIVR